MVGQSIALDLGDDVHQASVDRVALTGQLRDLLEQRLQPLTGMHPGGQRCCGGGHNPIIAEEYDNFRTSN
ncbi:hypothetical protein ABIA30_004473 [Mycobacterium sp. MAA66]